MARYRHNYKDGDIIRDVEFNETFEFSDSSDGFKAQEKPHTFRFATEQEKMDYINESSRGVNN